MATLRQILANRRNAKLSTGPRSAEGRAEASTHATKHGMSAATWFLEEEQRLYELRLAALEAELRPEGEYQRLLVGEIAAASIRIERCRLEEETWRGRTALRAECFWDLDRRAEVVELGGRIRSRPELVAVRLRQSLQGADWLVGRWRLLGARLIQGNDDGAPVPLDEESLALAADLLGLCASFRLVGTPLVPPGASASELAAHQAAFVAAQIDELEQAMSEGLAAADEFDRSAAELGQRPGVDPTLRLIRRYEADAQRLLRRAHEELLRTRAQAAVEPEKALPQATVPARPMEPQPEPEEVAAPPTHEPRPSAPTQPVSPSLGRKLAGEMFDQAIVRGETPLPLFLSLPADPVSEELGIRMIPSASRDSSIPTRFTAHPAHEHRPRRPRSARAAQRALK